MYHVSCTLKIFNKTLKQSILAKHLSFKNESVLLANWLKEEDKSIAVIILTLPKDSNVTDWSQAARFLSGYQFL